MEYTWFKKMKNAMRAVALVAAVLTLVVPARAGTWVEDNRDGAVTWMYLQDGGGYMTSSWLQDGEIWYYLDASGQMVTGRRMIDGKSEVFDESGAWQYSVITPMESEIGPGTSEEAYIQPAEMMPAETEKTADDLEAEAAASAILAAITNENMGKQEKADAIYNWIRANTTYSNNGMYPPEYTEGFAAVYGFTRHKGNCYVYYAMSKYLLELCDMPSIRVVRASDGGHFWNLVDVDGTYYHFDACPRRINGRWCLVTTAYLQQTSWRSHNFDIAAYPATP